MRTITICAVNSVLKKSVSFALVEQPIAFYLCSQKLIDVQQTLIECPNPLKNTVSFNPGKTNKNPISVNFFFFLKFKSCRKIFIPMKTGFNPAVTILEKLITFRNENFKTFAQKAEVFLCPDVISGKFIRSISRRITIHTVISLPKKSVSFTLVEQPIALYLCSQKLIDVQQTLIANPNPLKNTDSFNPGKTNNPISVNFFFLNLSF